MVIYIIMYNINPKIKKKMNEVVLPWRFTYIHMHSPRKISEKNEHGSVASEIYIHMYIRMHHPRKE